MIFVSHPAAVFRRIGLVHRYAHDGLIIKGLIFEFLNKIYKRVEKEDLKLIEKNQAAC